MATIDEVLVVVNQILDAMVTRPDGGSWGIPSDFSVLVRQDQPAGSGSSQFKVEDVPIAVDRILGRLTGEDIKDLTVAEVLTLIGVAAGADVTGSNSPQAHKASHQNAGGDEVSVAGLSGLLADDQHVLDAEVVSAAATIKLDDFATPDDNADLNATTTEHGLLKKLDNVATNFMNGQGNWAEPAGGGGGVDTSGTPVANDIARFTDVDTIEGRSYAELKADLNLEIGTDVLAEQTIGIADDNLLEVDDADAADNDYAKFTANGLEGREYSEVKTDLSLNNVENTAHSTDAHTMAIDGRDVSADGSKLDGIASGADVTSSNETSHADVVVDGDFSSNGLMKRTGAGAYSIESIGAVDSGTAVPASPNDYDLFLHTPIGRKILLQYDGSGWIPLMLYGTTTIYVDGGSGSDSTDKGGAIGAGAFATVQYALDMIPLTYRGNVTVSVASGTYAENAILRSKKSDGDYSITIIGTLVEDVASRASTGNYLGSATAQGYINDTGIDLSGYANTVVYEANNDQYKIIDAAIADRLTVVGRYPAVNTGNYAVYHWGTIIGTGAGLAMRIIDCQSVFFENISFTGTGAYCVDTGDYSVATFTLCNFVTGLYDDTMAFVYVNSCVGVHAEKICVSVSTFAGMNIYDSKFSTSKANETVIAVAITGYFWMTDGTILDGQSSADRGISASSHANVSITNSTWVGNGAYCRVREFDGGGGIGLYATTSGSITTTTNTQFSNNDANIGDDAGSEPYGYVTA